VAASACAQAQAHAAHARHEPSGPAATLLRLHRDFGNQSVQRMLRAPSLQRSCACGGECDGCRAKEAAHAGRTASRAEPRAARLGREEAAATRAFDFKRRSDKSVLPAPAKAATELAEDVDESKPDPKNGSATIKCDGSGDYEILYGSYENATCGTKGCVTKHESSHIKDWKAKWPNGCKNQPKGYLPKGDPPDEVLMTVAEYNAFLKQSECTAHTVDLDCANALPQPADCEQTVKDYIKLTSDQKKNWC
jgi:hypothetical protein